MHKQMPVLFNLATPESFTESGVGHQKTQSSCVHHVPTGQLAVYVWFYDFIGVQLHCVLYVIGRANYLDMLIQ